MSPSTKFLQIKNSDSKVVNEDESRARDQAQSRLRISELRYRRLFEAARDGILILDAVTLKITDVNPFMTELLGYSHAEFLGNELWEIGLFSDKEASQEAFKELQRTGYLRYEDLPLQDTNGKLRDVEFVSNVYEEDSHQVISATSATSLIESERRKNGSYSWQRHKQHAQKLIRLTTSRMSFLPPCHMNCGLLLPRSSAGHICSPTVGSINSKLLVRLKPSLATLELKGGSLMNCSTSRASWPTNSISTYVRSNSRR